MKNIIKILFVVGLLVLSVSCFRDRNADGGSGAKTDGEAVLSLKISGAQAAGNPPYDESSIVSARLIVYHSGTPTGVKEMLLNTTNFRPVTSAEDPEGESAMGFCEVIPGGYINVYLIANEDAAGIGTALAAIGESSPESDIEAIRLSYSNAQIDPSETGITMFRAHKGLKITPSGIPDSEGILTYADGATFDASDFGKVKRNAVKLNIRLSCKYEDATWTSGKPLTFKSATLKNIPNKPWLGAEKPYGLAGNGDYFDMSVSEITNTSEADKVQAELTFIIPEHIVSNIDRFTYMEINCKWNNTTLTYKLPLGNGLVDPSKITSMQDGEAQLSDYYLERNTEYTIIATIEGQGESDGVEVYLFAKDWDPESVDGDNLNRTLNVSTTKVTFTYPPSARVYFWSNQPDVFIEPQGFKDDGMEAFTVDDFFEELSGVEATNITYDDATNSSGYIDLKILASQDLGTYTRRIILNAGGLEREITVNATKAVLNYPAYPGVIGYDPVEGDLNLEGRGVMVYFKFGGIIAMYSGSGDSPDRAWHGAASIAFNPWPDKNYDFSNYLNFPDKTGISGAGTYTTVGNVNIDQAFHGTIANAKNGNGDPCRFIKADGAGMTAAQVKAALNGGSVPDQGIWRLPTLAEDEKIAFSPTQTDWVTQASPSNATLRNGHTFSGLNKGGSHTEGWNFLPATGYRSNSNGTVYYQGSNGYYWPSTPNGAIYANSLHFNSNSVLISSIRHQSFGQPVRCVRVSEPPYLTATRLDEGKVASTGGTATFEVETNVPTGWTASVTAGVGATLSAESGNAGKTTVTLTFDENTTFAERTATITVTGAGVSPVVITITQKASSPGVSADILYFAPDGTLQCGWIGSTTTSSAPYTFARADMAFFQFGSVVGFTNNNDDWIDSHVKFNPVTPGGTYGYTSIPKYNNEGGDDAVNVEGYITNTWHTGANVKAGKGDPCKLVGLTAQQVKDMSEAEINAYNSGWRLPTANENVDFVAAPTGWYGLATYPNLSNSSATYWGSSPTGVTPAVDGGWFPIPGDRESTSGRTTRQTDPSGFLPAAGDRSMDGFSTDVGTCGCYWSSTIYNTMVGYSLEFYSGGVYPRGRVVYTLGYAVRCVRDLEPPYLTTTRLDEGEVVYTGGSATFEIKTNIPTGWTATVTAGGAALTSSTGGTGTTVSGTIGTSTVTLTFDENTTFAEITATITVTSGDGTITREIVVTQCPLGGSGDIIFFEGTGANTKLVVGKMGEGGLIRDNMAFFQFGSVVGFTNSEAWGTTGRVQFNPVTPGEGYANYTSIPKYNNEGGGNAVNVEGYITKTWHTAANVKAGKGDPCKLVGLTAQQVKDMSEAQINAYNSEWRLPTMKENIDFVAAPTEWHDLITNPRLSNSSAAFWGPSPTGVTPDVNGGWFPIPGDRESTSGRTTRQTDPAGFLPAAGERLTSGNTLNVGSYGYYWSSTVYDTSRGYFLFFDNSYVYPRGSTEYAHGFSVRCVRQ